uniref:Uncharacterized protein n=1 Tax=Candidozyma auris TaxID=498019 RepID=A0A0L0P4H8_CANAR
MLKEAAPSVSEEVKEALRLIEDLKFFLVTAPANWQENQVIRRYYLDNDEGFVSCVFWNNLYFITGTDIVRCILYKFEKFGRTIIDRKKFEEGIFSDLRNLKTGTDAVLEGPKSPFLNFLYKNACLRTQKKQKVFYWFNVPHDKLMADALDRDLKRERLGQTPSSKATREPALSFQYVEDKSQSLYEQLTAHLSLSKYNQQEPVKDDSSDSPEYTCHQRVPGYGDDNHIEANDANDDDDDDDFPLDFIEQGPRGPRDYISLNGPHHSGSYINGLDSDFDSIDASFVTQTPETFNIASTEDYLIEQTQPSKQPFSASQSMFPRSVHGDEGQVTIGHPQIQPQYPTNIPSGTRGQFPPMATFLLQPLNLIAPYYEPGYGYVHDLQMLQSYYPEDMWFAGPPTGYPAVAPVFDDYSPYRAAFYEPDYLIYDARPSLRQREISHNMMRKRQQLQPSKGTKMRRVGSQKGSIDNEAKAQTRTNCNLATRNSSDNLMPTPESSANVQNDDHVQLQKSDKVREF